MTRRQELETQLHTLQEISGIMAAMKNLALVEIRKLNRLRGSHQKMQQTIQATAEDFFAFHPHLQLPREPGTSFLLVIGSERGFCGSFNQNLLDAVEGRLETQGDWTPGLIPVGSKLATKLDGDPRVTAALDGANAAEEVAEVLNRVLTALQGLPGAAGGFAGLNLWAAYHDYDEGGIHFDELTEFPPKEPPAPRYPHPPLLNLPPLRFLAGLLEHHLFALLTRIFYTSLMVENRHRLSHMENATRRIEGKTEELTLTRNILRQEEITQEIEIILLNVEEGGMGGSMPRLTRSPGAGPSAVKR